MTERQLCDYCDNYIYNNHYYNINGDIICPKCMEECFKKEVDENEPTQQG